METTPSSQKDVGASNGHQVIVVSDSNKTTQLPSINDAQNHEIAKSKSFTNKCKLQIDQSILQSSATGLKELYDELNKFVMKAVHTVVANFCKPTNEKEELDFLFLKSETCNCTANLMETLINVSQQEASKNADVKTDEDTTAFVISAKTYKTFCIGTLLQAGLVRLIGNPANITQQLISQIDASLKLEDVLHASSVIKILCTQHNVIAERIPTISKDLQHIFRILSSSYANDSSFVSVQKIAYTVLFSVFMNIQLLKNYRPRLLATSIIGVAKSFSSSSSHSDNELTILLEALKTAEAQDMDGRLNTDLTLDNLKACMQSVESFWSRVSQPMRLAKTNSATNSPPAAKVPVTRTASNPLMMTSISNNIMSNMNNEPAIPTAEKNDLVVLSSLAVNSNAGVSNTNQVSSEKIKIQKDTRGMSYPAPSLKQPLHHSQSWPVQSVPTQPQVTVFKSNISLNLKWIMTRGRKRTKAASNIPPIESHSQDKEHSVPMPSQNWTNFMEVRAPKAFVRNTNLNPFPSLIISIKDQKQAANNSTIQVENSVPSPPTNNNAKVPVARTSSSSSNLMGSLERTNSSQEFMVIDSDSEPDITEIGVQPVVTETTMFEDCICKIQVLRADTNEYLPTAIEGEVIKPISKMLVNFHRVRLVGNTSFAGKKNSSPIHFKFCFTISNTKDGTKMAEVFSEPFLIVSHTKLLEDGNSQLSLIELIPDGAFTANHCPTKICILGSNLTHHHVVTIGNIFAKNLHLVSDEVLIVQFPILPPGRYPVQVHGPGKNPEISNTLTFTLFEPVTNLKLPPLMKPFGQTETVPIPSPSSGSMTGNKALKRDRPENSRGSNQTSAPIVISSAIKSQKVSPARKMTAAPVPPAQTAQVQAQPQQQQQVQQSTPAPVQNPSPQPPPVQAQPAPQQPTQPQPAQATPVSQPTTTQPPQGAVPQAMWPMYGQSPYPFFMPGVPGMPMPFPMMVPYQYPGMQYPAFQAPPNTASDPSTASQPATGVPTQLPPIQAFPVQMAYYPMEAQQAQPPTADAIASAPAMQHTTTSMTNQNEQPPTLLEEPQQQGSNDRIQLPSISQLQTNIPFEGQGQVPWFQNQNGFMPRSRS